MVERERERGGRGFGMEKNGKIEWIIQKQIRFSQFSVSYLFIFCCIISSFFLFFGISVYFKKRERERERKDSSIERCMQ